MKLRYVGQVPTTFMTHGGAVEPGGEFDVPDDVAESFLGRRDVEAVSVPEAALDVRPRKSAPPAVKPAAEIPAVDAAPSE